ncbi:hypothetical protein [Stutzerimonas stutzeri]|uniref:hypothetical protein n=1 Tax=Stutzerimonas stutzeri TaxID=316 RepID=UPI001CFCD1EE|nr:hypothetical protein [Stutzerimonas stutzeri]
MKARIFLLITSCTLCLTLSGCAIYGPHWTTANYFECYSTAANCLDKKTVPHTPTGTPAKFILGIIEFDQFGNLLLPEKTQDLLHRIDKISTTEEIITVVFVHGWKNSAANVPGGDLQEFLQTLQNLAFYEENLNPTRPRKVIGVYLGWRGASLTIPVFENLTFWERKNTAQAVGDGAVAEILIRLNSIRERNIAQKMLSAPNDPKTRLIIIGHSFGGAIVHTALSQVVTERLIASEPCKAYSGLGDLTVLINPAFEAMQFSTIHKLAQSRNTNCTTESLKPETQIPENQYPSYVVLTSKDDKATGFFFPIGRFFSTIFERYSANGEEQRITDLTAVGHYENYTTHTLEVVEEELLKPASLCPGYIKPSKTKVTLADEHYYPTPASQWRNGANPIIFSNNDTSFTRPILKLYNRLPQARNPVLNISSDNNVITGHSDIYSCYAIFFLGELIRMTLENDNAADIRILEKNLDILTNKHQYLKD